MASQRRSECLTVNMSPNKKAIKFGVYPGVRNTKIIPIAMPSDHNIAIALSSRRPALLLVHSIPNDDKMAKTPAPINGGSPKKYAMPIPPKEACVIPPLMNTLRRATTYVPIMPATTEVRIEAIMAFWKKTNENRFKKSFMIVML